MNNVRSSTALLTNVAVAQYIFFAINNTRIPQSSFFHCKINTTTYDEDGGGCVYLESITTENLIKSSSFVDSSVSSDTDSVDIWYSYCSTDPTQTLQDCRFLRCTGEEGDAGGILVWSNYYNLKVCYSPFCECSNTCGGGVQISLRSHISTIITSCFFSENSADSGEIIHSNTHDLPMETLSTIHSLLLQLHA